MFGREAERTPMAYLRIRGRAKPPPAPNAHPPFGRRHVIPTGERAYFERNSGSRKYIAALAEAKRRSSEHAGTLLVINPSVRPLPSTNLTQTPHNWGTASSAEPFPLNGDQAHTFLHVALPEESWHCRVCPPRNSKALPNSANTVYHCRRCRPASCGHAR